MRQTEGSAYTGPQTAWQEALLKEQGYICAYCMKRISTDRETGKGAKPKIEIEHYFSRETRPSLQLVWRNMLGVCNGNHGLKPHCDKADGGKNPQGVFIRGKIHGEVALARLNPLSRQDSEDLLTYSLSGEIKSTTGNPEVEDDLNFRLNLNDEKLMGYRKDQIDLAKKRLEIRYPNGQWTQIAFDREIEFWLASENGMLKPYFKAIVWFLNWMKQRPKYT
ncbi:MAG: hypothetical protein ACKVUS_05830 [Saprospiraceae bacterium]